MRKEILFLKEAGIVMVFADFFEARVCYGVFTGPKVVHMCLLTNMTR
jgi:hypothetical protein